MAPACEAPAVVEVEPWSCCLEMAAVERSAKGAMPPANPYEAEFRAAAAQTRDVPWWLLAGMGYETSHFRADAHGPTNDWGIMQVIESNAPGCGLTVADLREPSKNIACAAALMQRHFDHIRNAGGFATFADTARAAIFSNNSGWGNVGPLVASTPFPRTWAKMKALHGGTWPTKFAWSEKLWARAQEFRHGDWVTYGLVAGAVVGAGMILWAVVR